MHNLKICHVNSEANEDEDAIWRRLLGEFVGNRRTDKVAVIP
jgi:hypothetical protein